MAFSQKKTMPWWYIYPVKAQTSSVPTLTRSLTRCNNPSKHLTAETLGSILHHVLLDLALTAGFTTRLLEEEVSHDLTICTKVDHWIYLLANNSLNNGESSPLQGAILDHSHPKPMNLLNWIFHITAHHWYINNRTTAFSTWQDILQDQLALSSWKRDVQLNFSLYQPTLPFHPTLSDFSPELITEIYTLFSKKTIEKVSEQNQHSGFYAR